MELGLELHASAALGTSVPLHNNRMLCDLLPASRPATSATGDRVHGRSLGCHRFAAPARVQRHRGAGRHVTHAAENDTVVAVAAKCGQRNHLGGATPKLPKGAFSPKQSLGQNYLSDQNYVLKIVNALCDGPDQPATDEVQCIATAADDGSRVLELESSWRGSFVSRSA